MRQFRSLLPLAAAAIFACSSCSRADRGASSPDAEGQYFEGLIVYDVSSAAGRERISCHVQTGSARCWGASRMPPGWITGYDGRTGRFCGGVPGTPWLSIGPQHLMSLLALLPPDKTPPPLSPPRPTGAHYEIAGVACDEVVFPPQDAEDTLRTYCLAPTIRLAGVRNWSPLFEAVGVRAQDLAAFTDDRGVIANRVVSQNGRVESSAVAVHIERSPLDPNRFNHLCDGIVY